MAQRGRQPSGLWRSPCPLGNSGGENDRTAPPSSSARLWILSAKAHYRPAREDFVREFVGVALLLVAAPMIASQAFALEPVNAWTRAGSPLAASGDLRGDGDYHTWGGLI